MSTSHACVSAQDVVRVPESEHSQTHAQRANDSEGESMTRTEKLVTAAIVVVNLSVGFVLIGRSDGSELVRSDPLLPATFAALSPLPEASAVRVWEAVTISEAVRVAKR